MWIDRRKGGKNKKQVDVVSHNLPHPEGTKPIKDDSDCYNWKKKNYWWILKFLVNLQGARNYGLILICKSGTVKNLVHIFLIKYEIV